MDGRRVQKLGASVTAAYPPPHPFWQPQSLRFRFSVAFDQSPMIGIDVPPGAALELIFGGGGA